MKYLIEKQQYKELIQKKKDDKIVNRIHEDINRTKKSLKSDKLIKESIQDIITIYRKKGLLTQSIVDRLNEENVYSENSIVL